MHLPELIHDLGIILGVAAVVTFLFRFLKQPLVLGYVVAGILVGPYSPTILQVTDTESIKTWAELGVVFLMFALGLEFSFRRLAKVGLSAAFTASFQLMVMIGLGYYLASALNWSNIEAVFLGCMIAISSTTIIIKALEELQLKTKKFAELVFGILIVEDLAAVIMLVGLASIASSSSFNSMELLSLAGKMVIIVGSWLLVGIFVVPKMIHRISLFKSNEMLVITSIALCLGLVSLSAYFHFSVALGAFIMGSILAETSQAKKIETLVHPLKDIFGAVFFVSVGMLLDPSVFIDEFYAVIFVCLLVLLGKMFSVSLAALITGQTSSTAIQTGLSMAQIGEFSFIIAGLGLSLEVIDPKIYPIIVAVSIITTFTTPYLIRWAPNLSSWLEDKLPRPILIGIEEYGAWFQRRSSTGEFAKKFYLHGLRWFSSAIVVIIIFLAADQKLRPYLDGYSLEPIFSSLASWIVAFLVSAPFIWSMTSGYQAQKQNESSMRDFTRTGAVLLRRLLSILLIGILSIEFFPTWISIALTLSVAAISISLFRHRLSGYYHWFESNFLEGFQDSQGGKSSQPHHLLPWDAHLVAIHVKAEASIVGKSLRELKIREYYGVSIVIIKRGNKQITAPSAEMVIYPSDTLLCFGKDEELGEFAKITQASEASNDSVEYEDNYVLGQLEIPKRSFIVGKSIAEIDFQTQHRAMLVGIERAGVRIENPKSDFILEAGDGLWIVAESKQLEALQQLYPIG